MESVEYRLKQRRELSGQLANYMANKKQNSDEQDSWWREYDIHNDNWKHLIYYIKEEKGAKEQTYACNEV